MTESAERLAARGADFELWKESPIGREVYRAAQDEQIEAMAKLASVDPEDPDEIRRLQTAAKIPAMAVKWIETVIQYGRNAAKEVELEDIDTGKEVNFSFSHR